jgi:hypothetical protein
MEQNLHETTNRWKSYGKQLFSEDLEVQDAFSTRNISHFFTSIICMMLSAFLAIFIKSL